MNHLRIMTAFAGMTLALFLTMATIGCSHQAPPPPRPAPVAAAPTPTPSPEPARTTSTSTPTQEVWQDIPVSILYPSGGSRLDDQARAMLREAHASMAHRSDIVRVRVEGHADGRGTDEANQRLALERAQGVVDFLVGELGMPRELFELRSYGDEHRRTSGTTAADRLQNRRVEFSILVRRRAAL